MLVAPVRDVLPVEMAALNGEIECLACLQGICPEIAALLQKGYLKEIKGKYDLKGAMFCSGLFKRPPWTIPPPPC